MHVESYVTWTGGTGGEGTWSIDRHFGSATGRDCRVMIVGMDRTAVAAILDARKSPASWDDRALPRTGGAEALAALRVHRLRTTGDC